MYLTDSDRPVGPVKRVFDRNRLQTIYPFDLRTTRKLYGCCMTFGNPGAPKTALRTHQNEKCCCNRKTKRAKGRPKCFRRIYSCSGSSPTVFYQMRQFQAMTRRDFYVCFHFANSYKTKSLRWRTCSVIESRIYSIIGRLSPELESLRYITYLGSLRSRAKTHASV